MASKIVWRPSLYPTADETMSLPLHITLTDSSRQYPSDWPISEENPGSRLTSHGAAKWSKKGANEFLIAPGNGVNAREGRGNKSCVSARARE